MIRFENVTKSFGSRTILDNVSYEIKKGEVIGQAIFCKYLTTDNDVASGERLGGFGSTSK